MKRLWIRAHALKDIDRLAREVARKSSRYAGSDERAGDGMAIGRALAAHPDPNDMVAVEVSDKLAAAVADAGWFATTGKVLSDGEEPPYLGPDIPAEEDA